MGSIVRSTGYRVLHRPVELARLLGMWPVEPACTVSFVNGSYETRGKNELGQSFCRFYAPRLGRADVNYFTPSLVSIFSQDFTANDPGDGIFAICTQVIESKDWDFVDNEMTTTVGINYFALHPAGLTFVDKPNDLDCDVMHGVRIELQLTS